MGVFPAPFVNRLKERGIAWFATATTLAEAKMARDTGAQYPTNPAEVKIAVHPRRAAVFVDNHFVGHVGEFEGPGRAMLLSPGKHHFRIALPGYQSFDTEVNLLANQRFELKTNLFGGDITQTDPVLKQ